METSYFFLDSDSPFNCLNASIKILLSYIRKFLRKKIINLEKINFITNKNKSAWNFLWYQNMYFYKLKLTCPKIFLKKILFNI
jgi:hypothetical protein